MVCVSFGLKKNPPLIKIAPIDSSTFSFSQHEMDDEGRISSKSVHLWFPLLSGVLCIEHTSVDFSWSAKTTSTLTGRTCAFVFLHQKLRKICIMLPVNITLWAAVDNFYFQNMSILQLLNLLWLQPDFILKQIWSVFLCKVQAQVRWCRSSSLVFSILTNHLEMQTGDIFWICWKC